MLTLFSIVSAASAASAPSCGTSGECTSPAACFVVQPNGMFTAETSDAGVCLEVNATASEDCQASASDQNAINNAGVDKACMAGELCIFDGNNKGVCQAPAAPGLTCAPEGICPENFACYADGTAGDGLFEASTDSGFCLPTTALATGATCQPDATADADISAGTVIGVCPSGQACLTDSTNGVCTDVEAPPTVVPGLACGADGSCDDSTHDCYTDGTEDGLFMTSETDGFCLPTLTTGAICQPLATADDDISAETVIGVCPGEEACLSDGNNGVCTAAGDTTTTEETESALSSLAASVAFVTALLF